MVDDLAVEYPEHHVTLVGHPDKLTATEYRMLLELSVNAGVVVTHDELPQGVWAWGTPPTPGLVRDPMKRLRDKLGYADSPRYICIELGVGHRMAKGEQKGPDPPTPTCL